MMPRDCSTFSAIVAVPCVLLIHGKEQEPMSLQAEQTWSGVDRLRVERRRGEGVSSPHMGLTSCGVLMKLIN